MIATKGKRKICFQGRVFYWWIKKEKGDNPRIHIISDDKKVYLKEAFDKEIGIGIGYIEEVLKNYIEKNITQGMPAEQWLAEKAAEAL